METYESGMERKEREIDRLFSLLETKDDTIHQLNDLVKRQRVIIEMFIKATEPIENHIVFYQNPAPNFNIMDILRAREAAQDTTSMTGASEK